MSQSNREIVQKANIALGDFAPGGILVATQAKAFLQVAIKKAVMWGLAETVPMDNFTLEQDTMQWATAVMQPGVAATALDTSVYGKPAYSKYTLSTVLYKGEVRINREVYEDQIERQTHKTTLMNRLGERVGLDFENLLINGNTGGTPGTFLDSQDGLLVRTSTYQVDAAAASLSRTLLTAAQLVLPEEYESDSHYFFTNRKARSDYIQSLGNRATPLGDTIITDRDNERIGHDGRLLKRIPMFPNNIGTNNTKTNVLYCDPKNAKVGIQRRITVDQDFLVPEQVFVVVITARVAINWAQETATSKVINVVGQ